MYLTPEQKAAGRRMFFKTAGSGAGPLAVKEEAPVGHAVSGSPVRLGVIGVGSQGSTLLGHCLKLPDLIEVEAICDVNPAHRAQAAELVNAAKAKPARLYEDWQQMLDKEKLEGVLIATPLWTHADITVGSLNAGVHVLCEKMMAYDLPSCRRMVDASHRNSRILEIGYPRFYEPLYQSVYHNIIQPGVLGDIAFVRLVTHRNNSWRRTEKPPTPSYNPQRWGYPDWDSLANWRMYKRYSQGLVGELGSHQTSLAEWYLGSTAHTVYGMGGIFCYKDGREVNDHIHMTFEHPGGCTVELSVILSNAYGGLYEEFAGTRGTLIVSDIDGGMLFLNDEQPTLGSGSKRQAGLTWSPDWNVAFRAEIVRFCSAVRHGTPLLCGPQRAMASAASALAGNRAVSTKERVDIGGSIGIRQTHGDGRKLESAGARWNRNA